MLRDAIIGVHAAYERIKGENGNWEARESGFANAQIGAYLNELGVSAEARPIKRGRRQKSPVL